MSHFLFPLSSPHELRPSLLRLHRQLFEWCCVRLIYQAYLKSSRKLCGNQITEMCVAFECKARAKPSPLAITSSRYVY
jgi:hypothetical protein